MNLHQFRFVQEAVRRQLNLTETAKALHTSQPGVSKAIIELEEELGIEIFKRHGKRLQKITEPGHEVLKCIEIVMREIHNMKKNRWSILCKKNGDIIHSHNSYASSICITWASDQIKTRVP